MITYQTQKQTRGQTNEISQFFSNALGYFYQAESNRVLKHSH